MKLNYDFNKFVGDVNGNLGFSISDLSPSDLEVFRSVVRQQFKETMVVHLGKKEGECSIQDYHNSSVGSSEFHKQMWPKKARILSQERLDTLLQTEFFSELKTCFDWWEITNEEGSGFYEVYFRLCRPAPYNDVGPVHADAWFWELGHGKMPKTNFETQRIKFWFSLETSEPSTGFKYAPKSHTEAFEYDGEHRDGLIKPIFEEMRYDISMKSLNGGPGRFIVFNDRLLHGGEVLNSGTRVSLEFTLLTPMLARGR